MLQQAISYKDRSGFVVLKNQSVHRYVSHNYARQYLHLMRSGLYDALVQKGLLIPHTTRRLTEGEQDRYFQVLLPEFIPVFSFPYEWTPSQWKQVVLATLEINMIAMEHGMILKDATPFNCSFHKGRCVFIDTLSFDFYTDGPWIAYRQFCETLLGPLALMHYNAASWAKLFGASMDGWSLPFIRQHLPFRSRFNLQMLVHIHWHSAYSTRKQQKTKHSREASFSSQKLVALWSMLYNAVAKWKMDQRETYWGDYYEHNIESPAYLEHKTRIIESLLAVRKAGSVLDLGSNNGKFSLIAAAQAQQVIAVEPDISSMEQLCRAIAVQQIGNISTIVADITQPSAGLGWNNEERQPLLQRLKGDMVLALALVHHLCITRNVPLKFVAALLHSLTQRWLIVEFVPKSDLKVQQMLSNREDVFDDYTEESFVNAFEPYFLLEEVHPIDSSTRKLFVWVKR